MESKPSGPVALTAEEEVVSLNQSLSGKVTGSAQSSVEKKRSRARSEDPSSSENEGKVKRHRGTEKRDERRSEKKEINLTSTADQVHEFVLVCSELESQKRCHLQERSRNGGRARRQCMLWSFSQLMVSLFRSLASSVLTANPPFKLHN